MSTQLQSFNGFKAYRFEHFTDAHECLLKNKWRSIGQDGCLNHLYTKVVAGHAYSIENVYAKVTKTITGPYIVVRVSAAEVRKAGL